MKILLVSGRYLPGKSGGIENYTHWLAGLLLAQHHLVHAAILESPQPGVYDYEGVQVVPLTAGFSHFEELLREGHYDICHFHEYSEYGGIELFWIKKAKELCKKTFFTFHLPYLTCYKNDFRYKGIEDCNNFSSVKRCVDCTIAAKLHYKKKAFAARNILVDAALPFLRRRDKAVLLKNNIISKHRHLRELIETCDTIFVIAGWFKNILSDNGYSSRNIKRIPPMPLDMPEFVRNKSIKHKIVFAGRIEKQKGLHLVCAAMDEIKARGLQLDVYGNIVDEPYFNMCIKKYPFNYKGVAPRQKLLGQFPGYDFLVLPSVFTEMYPLVLHEAFSAGLPVIVSSAKGNVDAVQEGKNAFVFEYNNAGSLAATINKAYSLLGAGWQPEFNIPFSEEENRKEILSYYTTA